MAWDTEACRLLSPATAASNGHNLETLSAHILQEGSGDGSRNSKHWVLTVGSEMRNFEADSYSDHPRGPPQTYYWTDYRARMDESGSFDRMPGGSKYPHPPLMQQISQPHHNDILMGRGGKNNQHAGNERLRQIARLYCEQYKVSKKKGKSSISRKLVTMVRNLDPPGRFLKMDPTSRMWEDVGDETAREKASQVLRDAVALVHPDYAESHPRQDGLYAVPSLDETAASSTEGNQGAPADYFLMPSPVQPGVKRARAAEAWEQHPRPAPVQVQPGFSSIRFTADGLVCPPALLSVDRRNSSTATAASLLGELHAEMHPGTLTEFDLFNGELLDGGEYSAAARASRMS